MSDLPGLLEVAANNTVSIVELQPESLAVLLYALGKIDNYKSWRDYRNEEISNEDIELIHELVDLASDNIMRKIVTIPVGATMLWHMGTPPDRWLLLDGSGWLVTEYPELFALWGYKYGGSDDFFGVPSMGSKSPYGVGPTVALDANYGAETHTLTAAEIPSHTHGGIVTSGSQVPARAVVSTGGAQTVTMSGITVGGGGDGDHNNMHPVFGVYYIVYAGKP